MSAQGNLLGFDADEHEPMRDFSPVPAKKYLSWATDSEFKDTKSGQGLNFTFEIIEEGDYKGRKVWAMMNLHNESELAMEIAASELASLCRAVGKVKPADSSDLHNIPVLLDIGLEPHYNAAKKAAGEFVNKIKGFSAANGKVETTAADEPASAPAETSKVPPWKRKS